MGPRPSSLGSKLLVKPELKSVVRLDAVRSIVADVNVLWYTLDAGRLRYGVRRFIRANHMSEDLRASPLYNTALLRYSMFPCPLHGFEAE